MKHNQGIIRTIGIIVVGVALLAYFQADIRTFLNSPEIKPKLNSGIDTIKNGLTVVQTALEQSASSTTATSTATSTQNNATTTNH